MALMVSTLTAPPTWPATARPNARCEAWEVACCAVAPVSPRAVAFAAPATAPARAAAAPGRREGRLPTTSCCSYAGDVTASPSPARIPSPGTPRHTRCAARQLGRPPEPRLRLGEGKVGYPQQVAVGTRVTLRPRQALPEYPHLGTPEIRAAPRAESELTATSLWSLGLRGNRKRSPWRGREGRQKPC